MAVENPERWQQVKLGLEVAMALSGPMRAAYLDRVGAKDPALRAELESLLASDERAGGTFLEQPAAAAIEASRSNNRHTGRRLGPYRLVEQIGSGGMGEVYRALRADREYVHQVAIKLVRAGTDADFVGQRLRTERQILASFQHPHIARLLDGGTTEDGIPYLVMELIEGTPITEYCDRQGLGIEARLDLFLKVCSAVQYAHQHAVIHRDLKPTNILVTAEGTPKLLDFGIAKILEPGAIPVHPDATTQSLRILTLDYASPEQLKGQPVSAASDVYALGVVLYELLTGQKPHPSRERPLTEASAAVLEPAPIRPSVLTRRQKAANAMSEESPEKLSRQLRGDLDNIVLMALRKEPERRYPTVAQFADDIHRHREHLPVAARRPTLRYRTTSFVARHAAAVAASALIALALTVGFVMTVREAQIADRQRALAQRRFDDVRKLADSLIFDIHDSIRDLPGAARSRRLLIATALRYLDGLAREAAGDAGLQRDLAAAYLRLGDLQGRALEANEGDYSAALRSYRRALALWQESLLAEPSNTEARQNVIVAYGKLSDLTWNLDDPTDALAYSKQTVDKSRSLASAFPDKRAYQNLAALAALDYGYKLFKIRGDQPAALNLVSAATARLRSLSAAAPGDPLTLRRLALADGRLGEILAAGKQYAAALAMDRSAQTLLRQLAATAPENADFMHLEAFSNLDIAGVLTDMGQYGQAEPYDQAALSRFRMLVASDPKVREYRVDVAQALTGLAQLAIDRHEPKRAIPLLHTALEEMTTAPGEPMVSAEFRFAKAGAQSTLGDAYAALAARESASSAERLPAWRQAKAWYSQALGIFHGLTASYAEGVQRATALTREIAQCDREIAVGLGDAQNSRAAHGASESPYAIPR